MERYFAEIQNGVVKRVIVCNSKEWCGQNLGGVWVETFRNHPTKNYGHKGSMYVPAQDSFIAPKPFDSWVLDEKLKWRAPKEKTQVDNSEGISVWNESKLDWDIVVLPKDNEAQ